MKSCFTLSIAATLFGVVTVNAKSIEVVGTGDGMEIVRAVAAAFMADNPSLEVVVPPSIGSGGGIAAVGSGKSLIARVARPLKTNEQQAGLTARPIFRLPSAFYVHPELAVDGLSHKQLGDIYSGEVRNWKNVGGPDLRIKVVRREETDSTLSVLRNSMPGWKKLKITSRSKTAVTTQEAVETVRQTKGAIGFGPFSRPLESSVKVLEVDGLHPTEDGYPSAATISYVWREPMDAEPVKRFVRYGASAKALALLKDLGAVAPDSIE